MVYAIIILLVLLICALKSRATRKRIEKLIWEGDHITDPDEHTQYICYGPLSKVRDEKCWKIRCKMYQRLAKRHNHFAERQWADILWHDKNYEDAITYYLRAANAGIAEAMYSLASAYYDGEHVTKNLREADQWATKGIAAGDSRCENIHWLCMHYMRK